ncbi:MAG: GH25 family lysozyme [Oscillospiraceae bacterium]
MKKKIVWGSIAIVFLILITAFILVWNGIVLLNNPSAKQYPVRGVDVSAYQGKIEWKQLASQDISFAFIKATEGSSFVDKCFGYNYTEAQKTNLRIGAYHFFSFDSEGKTQAENFISTVDKIDNMLPPVVDFEFYADKKKNPPDAKATREQLNILLLQLENHYGVKPIIYATQKSYSMYLDGYYDDYDLWIRNVITLPTVSNSREWTFWQYTNRKRLKGYSGEEKYIDVNVFNGTIEEFYSYKK